MYCWESFCKKNVSQVWWHILGISGEAEPREIIELSRLLEPMQFQAGQSFTGTEGARRRGGEENQ